MRGEYRHAIDAKGRLFLPAKLREELGEELVLSRGTNHNIKIYSLTEWELFEEKIKQLPTTKAQKVNIWMHAFSSDATVDAQGRVAIPQSMRDYASLEKNIVSIGAGDHMEIYSQDYYDANVGNMDPAEVESILLELGV